MKKRLALALFLCLHVSVQATIYYVSLTGANSNSGTTPAEAWQSLSKMSSIQFQKGDSVLFRRGDRFEGQLQLHGDSLYLGAFGNGANPVFSGARRLAGPFGWQTETVNALTVYKTIPGHKPYFVFINDIPHHLARTPDNNDYYNITQVQYGANFQCGAGNHIYAADTTLYADTLTYLPFTDLTGSLVSIRSSGWTVITRAVTAYDKTSGRLTVDSPSWNWNYNGSFPQFTNGCIRPAFGFILSGKKEFISQPGEFFYDDDSGMLFIAPYNGAAPDTLDISVYDHAVLFTSPGQHHIVLENLEFEAYTHTGILLSKNASDVTVRHCRFRRLPIAINTPGELSVSDCVIRQPLVFRVTIEHCDFSDLYRGAIHLNCQYSTIAWNDFHRIGTDVNRAEWTNGPRSTLAIDGMPGLPVRTGSYCHIHHNVIDDTGHYGILPGDHSTVERNSLRDLCLNYADCGALYAVYNTHLTFHDNLVENVWGNDDRGDDSGLPGAGNGIYIDYNGQVADYTGAVYDSIFIVGNTVKNAGRGIAFLASADPLLQPGKFGKGFCQPPVELRGNTLYDNRAVEFSVGALAVSQNLLPANFSYRSMQFSENTLAHFDVNTPAISWSNDVPGGGTDWGVSDGNCFLNANHPLLALRKSNLTDLMDHAEWVRSGEDSTSRFILPVFSHIITRDTLLPGNLAQNPGADTGTNGWTLQSSSCGLPLNAGNAPPFDNPHFSFYNPANLFCINNRVWIRTNLRDGSNAPVSIDSASWYDLSFDTYCGFQALLPAYTVSLIDNAQNKVLYRNRFQADETIQRYHFKFQPLASSANAHLEFYLENVPQNYGFQFDNAFLFPVRAEKWDEGYKFPLFSNPSDDTLRAAVTESCFLYTDSTPVVSPVVIRPFGSMVLIRTDTCSPVPAPEIIVNGNPNLCQGDSVILSAPEGYQSYLWSTGETRKSIAVYAGGQYTLTAGNVLGSAISTPVTVTLLDRPEALIDVQNDPELLALPAGAIYQWLLNGMPLPGATAQTHTAVLSGIYTVVVEQNGCRDTSDAVNIVISGVREQLPAGFTLQPNPASDYVRIQAPGAGHGRVAICNVYGQRILETEMPVDQAIRLDIGGLPPGIYAVRWNDRVRLFQKF